MDHRPSGETIAAFASHASIYSGYQPFAACSVLEAAFGILVAHQLKTRSP